MPPTRPAAAWALLGAVQHAEPEAVEAVLRDPAVGAWAFQLLRQLAHASVAASSDAPPWAGTAVLGSLAAAAAIRAGTRCSLRVPARRGRLWLPSLGLTGAVSRGEWPVVGVERGPSGTVIFGDSGSVRLPKDLSSPAEGWSPLPRVGAAQQGREPAAGLDHLSPYRDFRSLRDPVDLAPEDVELWRARTADAYELLRAWDPAAYRVVTGTVRSLVPIEGAGASRITSASVPDAYGAVSMSLPADPLSFAATLIHEARHQLLLAVGDLTPLFTPVKEGPEPAYFAPWRDDPRPLRGLLYGAHAFAGVTSFWRRRRPVDGERADFEYALHRWELRTALAALRNATGLTEAGGLIVAALAESAGEWWADPVHGLPGQLADLCCRDTQATWRAAHLVVDERSAGRLAQHWLDGHPPPVLLPAARLTTRPAAPGRARTRLARLRFADPKAFDRVRADLGAGAVNPLGITGATPADAALIAGDIEEAVGRYRAAAGSTAAWIGIGLAGEARAALLVERPELVLALHAALLRRGVEAGPEELAEWLGSHPRSPETPVRCSAGRCRSRPA
ncbi:HEXXH motif-containing putative peptide modification protein [Streptomyces sp. A3M-1-3]|uniref:aKG-HExxH-type peptide beta-hydroxylase n=1 Tax=Streptomyces sp. A3M-1-3 TaxID=2962044 RepID=UPI0020B876EB|nr:HEXXH motif-containing putative peptide modification protein [Streptomyces sp. A3M-1-3]MCP3818654.1 HEXXH motif-containing putative peptide modification protein [Streptomyces sp. A3M-1-3]